ncbi:MAG: guanylate kinase [Vicinamibacteraceae bacterium]
MSSGAPSGHHRGRLFVVSAPSGTGKTTVAERLVARLPDLVLSRSYTSRPARVGEQDGVDYHFVPRDRFEAMIAAGEFLEWADVFGNLYGTCGPETERLLSSGRDVVLVIDVQGAQQVRECGLAFVSIFVLPPSFTELEQRLRGRSKDSDGAIRRRLDVASSEVSGYHDYDYVVVNDDLDVAVDGLRAIVVAERARVNRMRPFADGILNTFPKRDQD